MELQELKIQLNKYGFYSLNKEPFLYAGLLGNGFTYTYKHPYYGDLTRVYIPNDINECASFLQNYYDYKKKENKVVTFNNYKVVNPIPSFKDKESEITETLAKNLIDSDKTIQITALDKMRKDAGMDILDSDIKSKYSNYIANQITQAKNNSSKN